MGYTYGRLSHNLGRAPAASAAVTETGAIETGIGSTDSTAARDGRAVTTGAAKSPRGASAESRRTAVGGAETAGT